MRCCSPTGSRRCGCDSTSRARACFRRIRNLRARDEYDGMAGVERAGAGHLDAAVVAVPSRAAVARPRIRTPPRAWRRSSSCATASSICRQVSAARLQRLCSATLDLASHRLDAWVTSLATRRLAEMRAQRPAGLVIGGYGWVVNLKPAAPPRDRPFPMTPASCSSPPGIPATRTRRRSRRPPRWPCCAAATSRMRRTGNANLLSIDLSSNRVRLATWLLDGVRQGQPLGALLGYRFERQLQDARLASFITFFRNVAPLVGQQDPARRRRRDCSRSRPSPPTTWSTVSCCSGSGKPPARSRDCSPVWRRSRIPRSSPGRSRSCTRAGCARRGGRRGERCAPRWSVHHAVQGNPTRAAAAPMPIATGDAPPPELDVVKDAANGDGDHASPADIARSLAGRAAGMGIAVDSASRQRRAATQCMGGDAAAQSREGAAAWSSASIG